MFENLIKVNCFSKDEIQKQQAAKQLEQLYGCEIRCDDMDESVLFAHHARGCTIIAAKLCKHVVIFQNVTIGSNLKYNKITERWENVGNPIIAEHTIICDGAKILGPIVIGANSVVAAGAIITKDIPENSIAYGVNQYKAKDETYDLVFHPNMIQHEEIIAANEKRIAAFNQRNK